MNLRQLVFEGTAIAVKAIRSNRLRSFLTMLGVATGIFAVVSILTMVNSMQRSVTNNLSKLGNTTMFVHHWPWAERNQEWYKFVNRPRVSYRDYQKLKQNLRNVQGVMFEATATNQTIKADGGRSLTNIAMTGVTHDLSAVLAPEFSQGRYFSELESHLGSGVCIVGDNIAKNLFPEGQPVGKRITVRGKRLQIIGVLKRKGPGFFPGESSDDDRVYVPYSIFVRMLNTERRSVERLITVKASSYEMMPMVENEVIGLIRAARGLKPTAENNFAINKQEALMNNVASIFGYLSTGGWVISIFSLLIGAFSIGNIMYISVRERTNEIGVQKALGATRGFILYQFITEAVLICLIGGLIGLGIVLGIGSLIELALSASGMPFHVYFDPGIMLAGISISVATGLLAGFAPALMAASVDPVVAIRAV
ncbi:MAG: ABC transporter permease [Bacteroidia bacterium]|nr:ABC transporter permease [Bacteroidia bacterium]